jgi:hypothetical protein
MEVIFPRAGARRAEKYKRKERKRDPWTGDGVKNAPLYGSVGVNRCVMKIGGGYVNEKGESVFIHLFIRIVSYLFTTCLCRYSNKAE